MQRYENKPNKQGVWKRILLEFLDFLRLKIENDSLTIDELESIGRAIVEDMEVYAAIEAMTLTGSSLVFMTAGLPVGLCTRQKT